ncbi:hypothetical protein OD632_005278 [Salmonella enterica]|nr:hypothetical protein [Salmonella enterica]
MLASVTPEPHEQPPLLAVFSFPARTTQPAARLRYSTLQTGLTGKTHDPGSGVKTLPGDAFYVHYTCSVVCDLPAVFGRSLSLMVLHNSAQFCTIFLTDFLPFPACTGAV